MARNQPKLRGDEMPGLDCTDGDVFAIYFATLHHVLVLLHIIYNDKHDYHKREIFWFGSNQCALA